LHEFSPKELIFFVCRTYEIIIKGFFTNNVDYSQFRKFFCLLAQVKDKTNNPMFQNIGLFVLLYMLQLINIQA